MLQRIRQFPHNPIFFVAGALYLWLVVEPRLIYQCFGTILPDAPVFLTGWSFLKNSLGLPGGFVMYVSGFLSQGFYHSWLGAVIIVLCALCLCELSRRHLVAAGYARTTVFSSLPAVSLFLIYSRYKHPLPACLAVCLGLLCSLVFERLLLRRLAARLIVYCIMAAVVFWLAAAGGLLIFALMTVIYAIFFRRDVILPVLALPIGFAIVLFLALYVFLLPPRQVFFILTPFSEAVTKGMNTLSTVLVFTLYGLVPVAALVSLARGKVFGTIASGRRKSAGRRKKKNRHAAAAHRRLFLVVCRKAVLAAIPIALTAAGLYAGHDPMSKPYVLAHDYSMRKQWDKIIELGRRLPKGRSNVYFNHDIIRALYHKGRLPYDMFEFPQIQHGLLLTHEQKASYLTELKLCDIFIELGHVNMAEKMASETLAAKNHSGPVVEKLAWINIIKGQERTARVYLNALRKDLVYRSKAVALLEALDHGFGPEQTAQIDGIRSRMRQSGHMGTRGESVEKVLTGLLAANPKNKMAFEYLMAQYLLTGQVDQITASADRFKELGYDTIPALYEEAMLIYFGTRRQQIDLDKYNIRRETVNRYMKFMQLINSMRGVNRQAVLNRLISEYGSSYLFYSSFGRVGLL